MLDWGRVVKHFKTYAIPLSGEPAVVDIEDCTEVYGEWPDVQEPCDFSPSGQCEYASSDYDTCIHCGRKT